MIGTWAKVPGNLWGSASAVLALSIATIGFADAQAVSESVLVRTVEIFATFSSTDDKIKWNFTTQELSGVVPVLNAGDTVKILSVKPAGPDYALAKFSRTYKRFTGESCSTRWFRKHCTRTYARDENTETIKAEPTSEIGLHWRFVNALAQTKVWREGEFPIEQSTLSNQIKALGPLEFSIQGAVEFSKPSIPPPSGAEEVSDVKLVTAVGSSGPEVWLRVEMEFTLAP